MRTEHYLEPASHRHRPTERLDRTKLREPHTIADSPACHGRTHPDPSPKPTAPGRCAANALTSKNRTFVEGGASRNTAISNPKFSWIENWRPPSRKMSSTRRTSAFWKSASG